MSSKFAHIKQARASAGLTQEEMASVLGVTLAAVASWENGRSFPRPRTLQKLSEVTGKSLEFLNGAEELASVRERHVPYGVSSESVRAVLGRVEMAQKELGEVHAALRSMLMMLGS